MSNLFDNLQPAAADLFFTRGDRNDPRLGEVVGREVKDYDAADVVIIGVPQDEGVRRNGGRPGAADAPGAIRREFYKLTPFNIKKRIIDLGDLSVDRPLEQIHDAQTAVVRKLLEDGKRVIVLGGGNDISFADGRAMAEAFGPQWWIAINVDSHLDVRDDPEANSGTPYRQLLDGGFLMPQYFYEVGYQTHFASPVYYKYLRELGVNRISLETLRSREAVDLELREQIRQRFIGQSSSLKTFFGFDLDAVRSADAPGTSAPSPLGLRAGEFITLIKYAAGLANTRIVEFSEVNPKFDIDERTSKLVAIGMHRFISHLS